MTKNLWSGIPIFLMLIAACNEGSKQTTNKTAADYVVNIDSTNADKAPETHFLSTETYVAGIISKRQEIQQQLPGINPEKAVLLFRALAQYTDTALVAIAGNESEWVDKYVNFYSESKGEYVPPANVQERIKLLATAGIEPWNIGEGYTDIRLVPNFFTDIFKSSLPPDYNAYLQLKAAEDTVLYSADAGLMISFNQVGKRVLSWEKFLETYPGSIFSPVAKDKFTNYFHDYLFGEDNTPSFADRDKLLLEDDNKAEYKQFVSQYGDARSGKIVKHFLDQLAGKITYEQLVNETRNAIAETFTEKVALLPVQEDFRTAQIEHLTKPVYDTVPKVIVLDGGAKDEIERNLDTIMYVQQGNSPYCLAFYTNRAKSGAGVFSGWVDVWVFKKEGAGWQTAATMLRAGGGGMYGNSGYFDKLVKMGTNTIGIVISGNITHMGSDFSWDDVIAWTGNKLEAQFSLPTQDIYDNGTGNQKCVTNHWMFQPGAQEHYDLLVFPGSCLASSLTLDKVTVPFRNGRYTLPEKLQNKGI